MAKKKTGRCTSQVQRGENTVDLISQLPEGVIEAILERVPIKVAVSTSVLSKKWRYHWTSIRKLIFDEDFFDSFDEYYEHAEIVHSILLQHSGSLDSLSLYVEFYSDGWECLKTIDLYHTILHLASTKGVRNCTLDNSERHYWSCHENDAKVFPTLFSCLELTQLAVTQFVVSLPANFRGFGNLVRVEFDSVLFCGDSLQFLTSTSPRLRYLTLSYCRGPSGGPYEPSILNVSSSSLKHLVVKLEDECHIIPLTKLECLESLDISCLQPSYMAMLVCLLRNAPNLLELKIDSWMSYSSYSWELDEVVMFWEDNSVMLKHLKLLKVEQCAGSENELLLLKVLLAGTPSLDKIDFVKLLKEECLGTLVQYPRASPTAKLVINGVVTDW